jgi:hypothetical protein
MSEGGRLFAVMVINGNLYKKDVTDYFMGEEKYEDWFGFKIEPFKTIIH